MNRPNRSRTLKPIDAMWLHMESSIGTILIGGLLLFEAPVDFARLRDQVAGRLLLFERFRQRPRPSSLPLTLPVWEPAPDFNLDDHLHRSALPEPAAWPQLGAFIEDLLARPLPRDRPLWQMHLIERYGSGSALVVCFSHIMADGLAAMYLFEAFTDAAPEAPPPARPPDPAPPGLADPLGAALRSPLRLLRGSLAMVLDPAAALRQANWQMQEAQNLAEYALRRPEARAVRRGSLSRATRVAASEPLPLAEIKAVGKALDGSVNDVLTAAVAGALRRYLVSSGRRVDGLKLHAAMPYNLRRPERRDELGNGFSIALLPLPVGIANPRARFRIVKHQMSFIKNHPGLPASYVLAGAASLLPAPLSRQALQFFLSKVTLVLTNVRGGPEPRYLAGQRIDRILFWVPTSGLLTLVVSILSYAGQVIVCFDGDAQAVPDLEALPAHFAAAWHELKSLPALTPTQKKIGTA